MKYIVSIGNHATLLFHDRETAGKALDVLAGGVIVHSSDWRNETYSPVEASDSSGHISFRSIQDAAYSGSEDKGAQQAFEAVAKMQTQLDEARSQTNAKARELTNVQKELDELKAAIAPPVDDTDPDA